MVPLSYVYFISDLVFLFIWFLFFFMRKDLRQGMLVVSFVFAILGIFLEYFWWTYDWWHPYTITHTRVGIEDALLGFSNGGIAATAYDVILRKKILYKKVSMNNKQVAGIIISGIVLMIFCFFVLRLSSFYSTLIAQFCMGSILIWMRKDLLNNALINGIFMVLISFPIFYFSLLLNPEIIMKTWVTHHLTGIFITGIPLEDIIFYFLTGFVVAPLYKYWQNLGYKNDR